jgi:hypothetical protein
MRYKDPCPCRSIILSPATVKVINDDSRIRTTYTAVIASNVAVTRVRHDLIAHDWSFKNCDFAHKFCEIQRSDMVASLSDVQHAGEITGIVTFYVSSSGPITSGWLLW